MPPHTACPWHLCGHWKSPPACVPGSCCPPAPSAILQWEMWQEGTRGTLMPPLSPPTRGAPTALPKTLSVCPVPTAPSPFTAQVLPGGAWPRFGLPGFFWQLRPPLATTVPPSPFPSLCQEQSVLPDPEQQHRHAAVTESPGPVDGSECQVSPKPKTPALPFPRLPRAGRGHPIPRGSPGAVGRPGAATGAVPFPAPPGAPCRAFSPSGGG